MKILLFILLFISSISLYGQYKNNGLNAPDVKDGIVNHSSGNMLGFINPDNFIMRHSFSMSYSSFGGQGVSLGVYTNSMFYRLMKNLDVQMDVSLVYSPYSSFGQSFQNDVNGIYISNASVNYRPFKDMYISLQYRSGPYSYYNGYNPYYGFSNGFSQSPFGHEAADNFIISK
ncbi:hypothetical protein BMS3Abin03_00190 [bacterium BMS3Abin03]|nr:hypothetical protein BMS3Abin03_00190 [bacterium BMS3Abin03]